MPFPERKVWFAPGAQESHFLRTLPVPHTWYSPDSENLGVVGELKEDARINVIRQLLRQAGQIGLDRV